MSQSKPIQKQPLTPQYLSVTEAAIILNVSKKKIYEWIREGRLAAFRIGTQTRTTRISKQALETFIQENTLQPQRKSLETERP